jgi:uncharacterized membrane protein YfcA
MDALIVVFGLGVGLLVGMTGIGGGSIMTPLLILVLGVKPVVAIGTDLLYAAITKTVGGWRHLRQGTVDLGISGWLATGSVPGALGGVWVLERIHDAYGDGFDTTVLLIVAAALLLTGVATLGRAVLLPDMAARERETLALDRRHKLAAGAIGLGVGFVLGISSAGSGALIAIGLIVVFRLTPRRVVGTDVFHAAILLWVASVAHLISGNVDLGLTANLLVGSIPGVWVGSHLSVRVPQGALRPALGIVLVAAGLGILTKAGLDVPAPLLIAVPLALGVGALLVARLRGPARDPEDQALAEEVEPAAAAAAAAGGADRT